MVARFILDLRSIDNEDPHSFRTTMSSFKLGAFTGNIGAPLGVEDSMWVGPADDIANECDKYEEEVVPFGVWDAPLEAARYEFL